MGRLGLFAVSLWSLLWASWAVSVIVSNGYEFHASLTSPQVTRVLVAANVSLCQAVRQLASEAVEALGQQEYPSCELLPCIMLSSKGSKGPKQRLEGCAVHITHSGDLPFQLLLLSLLWGLGDQQAPFFQHF